MLTGALLGLLKQLGLDIITLTEEIDEDEFFASRLTRSETLRLLGSFAQTASNLPEEVRKNMPEIDWLTWTQLAVVLSKPSQHRLQIWVAIKELTPMTLQQLNDYKRRQPRLFSVVS